MANHYDLRDRKDPGTKQFTTPSSAQRQILAQERRLFRNEGNALIIASKPANTDLGLKIRDIRRRQVVEMISGGEYVGCSVNIIELYIFHLCQHVNRIQNRAQPGQIPVCYLQSHAWSAAFLDKRDVTPGVTPSQSLTADGLAPSAFMKVEHFFIPIRQRYPSLHTHSQLMIISPVNKTIEFRCSGAEFYSINVGDREIACAYQLLKDHLGPRFDPDEWRVRQGECPQQGPTANCGIHTLTGAMNIAFGYPTDYQGKDTLSKRLKVASEILHSGFVVRPDPLYRLSPLEEGHCYAINNQQYLSVYPEMCPTRESGGGSIV
ncbi:MAG: Smt3-specific protease [Claussenomyces sp. TS43310]|nr:MAG: Smt3-specific protease [Claussenomyces sp. TS43310]